MQIVPGISVPTPLLSGPFTRPMAAAVGVSRSPLERMIRDGVLRRILHGVYADAALPDDTGLRAAALGLVVEPGAVLVDRSAGWLHGLETGEPPRRPDALGSGRAGRRFGAPRPLAAEDVVDLGPVRATGLPRTVVDLGRLLPDAEALALLDAALRTGRCTHRELLAVLPRVSGQEGGAQVRRLVALADGRARDAAESVLRLRWLDAGLPTPVPGLVTATARGAVRLTLGLPEHGFAALVDPVAGKSSALEAVGWSVATMTGVRVLGAQPDAVEAHLRERYHQHLLRRCPGHPAG